MTDFPADVGFRPHGIAVDQETNTLTVVNHAWALGGSRIELFKIIVGGGSIKLKYLQSIESPTFPNGVLNSAALLFNDGDSEFGVFVSSWLAFECPLEGVSKTYSLKSVGAMISGLPLVRIQFCTSSGGCRPVGARGTSWNGIELSADKRHLVVADSGW
ncbi:unnamed protein product, partial [Heterosigma akashiwo]